ncbi:MAG: S-adenosylmethionine:tRNA ribosyltransferase-isomerase [Nannocystaceae bacterium]
MKARTTPDKGGDRQRLLVIDPARDAIVERTVGALPQLLRAGDRLVVNDAATMPASLRVRAATDAALLELRFAGPPEDDRWPAVLMGPGDWRTDTDRRAPPPVLLTGDTLAIEGGGRLEVVAVDPYAPRLVEVRFDRDQARAWALLLRHGRPVQYAYLERDVELAQVQTSYAGRPWSVEMPSAGRPLTIATLLALRAAGIGVSRLTHAAGLSATGDPTLDRRLPLPERYALPQATVDEIARSRAAGGRIVAVGTSVVRALEGNARARRPPARRRVHHRSPPGPGRRAVAGRRRALGCARARLESSRAAVGVRTRGPAGAGPRPRARAWPRNPRVRRLHAGVAWSRRTRGKAAARGRVTHH